MNDFNKENISRDNVLALDIATKTGYCSTRESGTWNFKKKPMESDGVEMSKFYDTIVLFVEEYGIKQIVAEDINVNNHFTDLKKLAKFRGVLELACEQLDLPSPIYVNVSRVKKWATGDGQADKKKMMEYCKKRWNIEPVDDNMADAVHIFKYYVRLYGL